MAGCVPAGWMGVYVMDGCMRGCFAVAFVSGRPDGRYVSGIYRLLEIASSGKPPLNFHL